MVMAIDDFKSMVKDVARPNRFLVQIVPNPSVFEPVGDFNIFDIAKDLVSAGKLLYGDPRKWFFVVKSISLPSRSLDVLEHKRMGVSRKVAGSPSYEDLQITFLNDDSLVARTLIEAWQENIVQQSSNYRQYAYKYAQGSFILVEQMSAKNKPIAIYKFNDVWPKSIDAVELNTESNDAVSELSISFSYNNWTKIL